MDPNQIEDAKIVMVKLMRNQSFRVFHHAPEQTEQLSKYLSIIQTPVFFDTIVQKLDNGEYMNPSEWIKDIELLVKNTDEFYGNHSFVSKCAGVMEKKFKALLRECALFDDQIKKLPTEAVSKKKKRKVINDDDEFIGDISDEIAEFKAIAKPTAARKRASKPKPRVLPPRETKAPRRSAVPDENLPPIEKEHIEYIINGTEFIQSKEIAQELFRMIQELEPHVTTHNTRAEVDLDTLKDSTKWKILWYIQEKIEAKKAGNASGDSRQDSDSD